LPSPPSFAAGAGRWVGRSEVYDHAGAFAGYGYDRRTVTPLDDGLVRVDVSFDGPFSFAGTYTIADDGARRRYLGPLNHGMAEPLGRGTVDATSHWPGLGLDQRLLLAVLDGGAAQVSLALLARGERHVWAVVGENTRVADGDADPPFAERADEAAGSLLLRSGAWRGRLQCLDGELQPTGTVLVEEDAEDLGLAIEARSASTRAGAPMIGSLSLFGARALAGTLSQSGGGLRTHHREVATTDGAAKTVCRITFDGGRRVEVRHGTMQWHG
jgi:hypothetical protein